MGTSSRATSRHFDHSKLSQVRDLSEVDRNVRERTIEILALGTHGPVAKPESRHIHPNDNSGEPPLAIVRQKQKLKIRVTTVSRSALADARACLVKTEQFTSFMVLVSDFPRWWPRLHIHALYRENSEPNRACRSIM
jgi:hypothetical protein